MEPAAMYSVPKLIQELEKSLTWSGFGLSFEKNDDFAPSEIPQPLRFAMAELCRNAEKYSTKTGSLQVKAASVSLHSKTNGGITIRISNVTSKPDVSIVCESGEDFDSQQSGRLGLFLVARVVCKLLRGRFTFTIVNGQATALVDLPSWS